jgi:hypothetical protein
VNERDGAVRSGRFDLIWTSPSQNSGGAMPCGGHSVGAVVWVEDGAIRFALDRSGSFDENNLMLKLGRVVIRLDPTPFAPDARLFVQRLDLHAGRIRIEGTGPDGMSARADIWCAVDDPVVYVDVDSSRPVSVDAGFESWRFENRVVPEAQRRSCFSVLGQPDDIVTRADTIQWDDDGVVFFHQNDAATSFTQSATLQGLAHRRDELWDPQRDRVFGGVLSGPGFAPAAIQDGEYAGVPFRSWGLKAPARTSHRLTVALHDDVAVDPQEFVGRARERAEASHLRRDAADATARAFWAEFWSRSEIEIRPGPAQPDDPDWQVGRNLALFRYLLGCNARGDFPTKFNGGLFTMDAEHSVPGHGYGVTTPDFRIWGGGSITGQNQRLVHWPMLKNGDVDLTIAQFEFYRRALGNAVIRTRELWGHPGVAFAEQLDDGGLPISYEWGWESPRDHEPGDHYPRQSFFDPTELARPWVRYHYSTQLEMSYLMLEAHRYAGLDIRPYLPMIDASVRFFDEHYRMRHRSVTGRELSHEGRLVITPSTALETYKDAIDPTDVVVGLRHVLTALLGPARSLIDDESATYYRAVLETVPPQARRDVGGHEVLAPARGWSDIMNVELPQLYGVFPYPDFGIGLPELEVARATYEAPAEIDGQRDHISWHQDGIFAARLGLTAEAHRIARLKLTDGPLRFPAFWGPGHDWTPDHNWGGSGMIGVQEMLVQEVEGRLHILPAWPDDLDVDFRLHAPESTVVSVSYRGGRVVAYDIQPTRPTEAIVHHKPVAESRS